jgi:hypothetical protein
MGRGIFAACRTSSLTLRGANTFWSSHAPPPGQVCDPLHSSTSLWLLDLAARASYLPAPTGGGPHELDDFGDAVRQSKGNSPAAAQVGSKPAASHWYPVCHTPI